MRETKSDAVNDMWAGSDDAFISHEIFPKSSKKVKSFDKFDVNYAFKLYQESPKLAKEYAKKYGLEIQQKGNTISFKKIQSELTNYADLQENTDNWDANKYKILKRKYNEAVKNGKTEFIIFGHTMLVEYAKYLLEHLSNRFEGIRENTDEDADIVEYHSQRKGEKPFKLKNSKWNGKI